MDYHAVKTQDSSRLKWLTDYQSWHALIVASVCCTYMLSNNCGNNFERADFTNLKREYCELHMQHYCKDDWKLVWHWWTALPPCGRQDIKTLRILRDAKYRTSTAALSLTNPSPLTKVNIKLFHKLGFGPETALHQHKRGGWNTVQ